MKLTGIISASVVIVAAFAGCKNAETTSGAVGRFASSLIADTTIAEYQIISASRERRTQGSIAVTGEPDEVLQISEYLVQCDMFDNISGRNAPDGLPDFAGETVSPYLDVYNSPYGRFLDRGDRGEILSETSVRNFAAALDTACFLNAYDADKIVHKSASKIVVMASRLAALHGLGDIDTLSLLTRSKVKVVSPVRAMIDEAWRLCGSGMNAAVWTTQEVLDRDVYGLSFERIKTERGDRNADCFTYVPDTAYTVTARFLDLMKKYAEYSGGKRLQALLVDDLSVSASELRDAVKSVMAVDQDRYITYLNYIDPAFRVIDLREAVAQLCYRYLRTSNSFTHKISYPKVDMFVTAASERDSSYVVIELKDRYLTQELRDYMIVHTPKIFEEYVR